MDDARYAQIPAEMARSGDWLTPTLNGLDYVEKPPLWYWLCAASYRLFGVGEWQARLPLALLSLLGAAGVGWLGSWLLGPGAGLTAAAALSVSPLWFGLSRYITLDLPLAVFLLWSTGLALRALLRPADARWAAPLAWTAAALAVLSKGLVGVVFPAAWTAALCVLEPGLRAPARALLRPLGPALFLLLAAPWFAAMQAVHPDFLWTFFAEHHVERFLTPRFNRENPWWFFLALLPAALLPWTRAAAAGARLPAGRPLALWVLLVTAFFSFSSSKLLGYIAPALPQAVLLAVHGGARPGPLLACAVLCLAAALALPWAGPPLSAKALGEHVAARLEPGDRVWTYGLYLHSLPFYTGRPVDRVVNWTGELDYARRKPGAAGRFGRDEDVMDLLPPARGKTFVAFRTFEAPYFIRLSFPGDARYRRFGPWTVAEFRAR